MKLHLPKQLFTALLAVITLAAPVSGLEITGSGEKTTITLNAGQSYYGEAIEYIVDGNGIGTTTSLTTKGIAEGDDDVVLTFELNHAAFDNVSVDSGQDSAKIIWVTNSGNSTWGLAAQNADTRDNRFEMRGLWQNVDWTNDSDYIDIAGDGKNTYTIQVGESGTYLYEGTTNSGTRVYDEGGLKASGDDKNLKSVSLNSAFIETFNVQEYETLTFTAGEWRKAYNVNEVKNAAATVLTVDNSNAESISASKHDIIAGGNGQLKIIAKDAEYIELGNVVYLAATKTAEKTSINIDNTGNVSLSGPIYLLENSSMSASGTGSITISGTVTDKNIPSDDSPVSTNSTLSLSGTGYNFTGAVDVTGLHLAAGTKATFCNLTVGNTLTNNGTMVLGSTVLGTGTVTNAQGRIELGSYTLNRFDDVTYTDGDSGFVNILRVFGKNVSYTSDVVVYVGDSSYKVSDGSIELNGADKTYYVNEVNHTATNAADATTFYIKEGASLNKLSNSTAVLAGSGVYTYGALSDSDAEIGSLGVGIGDYWSGYIGFSGGGSHRNLFRLEGIGSAYQLTGVSGYLDTKTLKQNIRLVNGTGNNAYGVNFANGWELQDKIATFEGAISGSGDMQYTWATGSTADATFVFAGDTHEWDGKFIRNVALGNAGAVQGKEVYVKFTKGGHVFKEDGNGGVKDATTTTKTFVVIDTNSNNSVLTTFNGSISDVNSLTVNTATDFKQTVGVSTLSVSDNTSFAQALTVSGTATVANGKTLTLGGGETDITHSIGTLTAGSATVTLEANSSLTLGAGAATHAIGTLTGSGALNMSNASATVATLAGYTGDITIAGTATFKATTGGKVSLSGISVLNGAKANIHTNQGNDNRDVNLGNVALTGGATLSLSSGVSGSNDSLGDGYIVTVNELSVSGGGELKTASDKTFADEDNESWQARFNIATLKGTTTSDTTLRLASTSNTAARTVFNLSTSGAVIAEEDLFSGNINLGVDNGGDSRKVALNIKNATVAKNAIIHLENSAAGSGEVALGIATDGVTLRGITDVVKHQANTSPKRFIESGEVGAAKNSFNKLIISTQNENDNFSTAATVGTHLNLQKDGAGSQTFNGDLSAFNGTVTVNQGTLALLSTTAMNKVGDITMSGGELVFDTVGDMTGTVTMTGGSLEIDTWNITTTQQFNASGDITMAIGAVNIGAVNDLEASGETSNYFTHEYEGTAAAVDGNGYLVLIGDFILFKGLEWDEAAWGALNVGGYGTVKSENGNTLVTVSNAGTGPFCINNDATYTDASILGSHGVNITQGKTLDLDITDAQTLSTELTGKGSLKKSGTGTLILSGVNTYSGGTTVAAGTLSITNVQSLGAGGVTVEAGAELEYAGSTESTVTALTLKGGAEVDTSSTGTLTATTAAATGAFTKKGTGTLVLSEVTQLGGTVTVDAGVLQIGGGGQKLNSAQVNGGELKLSGVDIINWGGTSDIQVLNADLNLANRQTVDSSVSISLDNGNITGLGGSSNHGYTVGLEVHDGSTLEISSIGTSSISTNIGIRNSNGAVKFDVSDGMLTVSGKIDKAAPTGDGICGSVTKSGAGELILSGNNTYAKGTTIEAGTVTTQHTNALGSGGVTMTGGELKVTDVADTDSDLALKGMLQMNATASAKLATAGTTLNLGTTGSVKKTNADGSQYVTISSDGATAASMTAKSANTQMIQLEADTSFTIADMALKNTSITAASVDTKVNLKNIEAENVLLAQGAFTLDATANVGTAAKGETPGTLFYNAGLGVAEGSTLTLNLDVTSAVAVDQLGVYDITITLSGFGDDFVVTDALLGMVKFDAESWLGKELAGASFSVDTGDASEAAVIAAAANGVPTVTYSAGTGENVGALVITISGLSIPEPTTSALSLLALAALAARRRRK